jgi:hypothetical protein
MLMALYLMLLSIPLLLFGGGIFPPLIGIIAGALGTRINKPLNSEGCRLSGKSLRLLAILCLKPCPVEELRQKNA